MNEIKKLEEKNNTLCNYGSELIMDLDTIEKYYPSESEKKLLETMFPKSFLDTIKNTHGKPILEQIKELNEWHDKINANKEIPKGILNYIVTVNIGEHGDMENDIGIKPNKFMPKLSSIFLYKQYSLIVQPNPSSYSTILEFNTLNNTYDIEKEKLKTCKDKEYVDNILKDLKAPINNFYKKNKVIIDEYKNNKLIFENYLKNQELLNEFNILKENMDNKKNIKNKIR